MSFTVKKLLLSAALTPLTLTIHSGSQTFVVHGSFNALMFSVDAVVVEYTSDRIFCSGFDAVNCAEVLP